MTAKNIVLCSDGTGNSGGKGRGTNVWQVFLAVDQHGHESDDSLVEQLAFYDDGVGTSSARWVAIAGKAFGVGLSRNIRELYTSLSQNYSDGDRLYLFGFSRGAFTIRSLSGMIADVGVIDRRRANGDRLGDEELDEAVVRAYRAYRRQWGYSVDDFRQWCAERKITLHRPNIELLGVWDTVSAIGVPFTGLRRVVQALAVARRPHCHDLNDKLVNVCHALAIDEARLSFKLEMFDQGLAKKDWPLEAVEQVWFAGVHSNVGGGYPKKGMESVSLEWMMTQAERHGLRFSKAGIERAQQRSNVHSELYDSRQGLALYYRYRARDVDALSRLEGQTATKIHVTALDRIRRATRGYAPINLPGDFEVVGTGRPMTIVAEPLTGAESAAQEPDQKPTPQREEERRIAEITDLVKENREELEGMVEPAFKLNKRRERLYYFFLVISLAVLAILLSQQAVEKKIAMRVAEPVNTYFSELSDGLGERVSPALDWADPLFGFLGSASDVLLPDMVAGPVKGLAKISELGVVIVLVGWVLLWIRRRLVERSHQLGSATWRRVLR